MHKLHLAFAAALLFAGAALAQQINTTPPPAPANCVPGSQEPACLPPPAPKPAAPATAPGGPPPAGGGFIRGFSTSSTAGMQKVVSYFQRGLMQIDAARAFGFVLLPKRAIEQQEYDRQVRFCKFLLGALDYVTPDEAARGEMLATYWPLVADVTKADIDTAFRQRECHLLINWYDHSLARSMARRAGIEGLSGPLLITWPSENAENPEFRDPLIVDFANADPEHSTKALRYWFAQLSNDPSLWTDRIREGTIRAELADAINDTAGVVMAVLQGKWESASAVSEAP
jgi:hypothetical protein